MYFIYDEIHMQVLLSVRRYSHSEKYVNLYTYQVDLELMSNLRSIKVMLPMV
jgi:hypothetical protein